MSETVNLGYEDNQQFIIWLDKFERSGAELPPGYSSYRQYWITKVKNKGEQRSLYDFQQ